jgi:hypothetical protein
MPFIDEFESTVRAAASRLRRVDDAAASVRPGAGRWSAKEIIGHLIDSASNNHQRFVRARWQDNLVFAPYDQDGWVSAQRYQDAPWEELVELWGTYNLHLARVMRSVPEDVRTRQHPRHNLDQLAWKPVPADEPATLDYFMRDYVGHLEHHLRQVEAMNLPAARSANRPRTLADLMGTAGFLLAFAAIVIGLVQMARWLKHLLF